MKSKGVFVVIEGPNGVGKSTIIHNVCELLVKKSIAFSLSKEPTASELGNFIRSNQDKMSRETLACLVAANRYEHISTLILPKLNSGELVISDRYYPSSLVYQRIDGLDITFIEGLNNKILQPNLTIFLFADETTLQLRMKDRVNRTRFETAEHRKDEVKFYHEGIDLLRAKGWSVLTLENTDGALQKLSNQIVDRITVLMNFEA